MTRALLVVGMLGVVLLSACHYSPETPRPDVLAYTATHEAECLPGYAYDPEGFAAGQGECRLDYRP